MRRWVLTVSASVVAAGLSLGFAPPLGPGGMPMPSIGREPSRPQDFVGKDAPDLTLKLLDGKTYRQSSLKGNVVLLDYWATWCGPCKASLPHINELARDKDLAAKGLRVFAANDGEDAATVTRFLTAAKYTFQVPLDPTKALAQAYRVSGIPLTILIGRDGKVAQVFEGYGDGTAEEIKAKVDELLAAPAPATRPAKR